MVEGVVDAVLAVSAREIGSWILNFETRLENPAPLTPAVFTVEWTNKGSTNEARGTGGYHCDLEEETSENTITEKGNEGQEGRFYKVLSPNELFFIFYYWHPNFHLQPCHTTIYREDINTMPPWTNFNNLIESKLLEGMGKEDYERKSDASLRFER